MFTTDADECASPETNSCDSGSLCTNTEGSYVCRCLRGYDGDGRNCTGNFCFSVVLCLFNFTSALLVEGERGTLEGS